MHQHKKYIKNQLNQIDYINEFNDLQFKKKQLI